MNVEKALIKARVSLENNCFILTTTSTEHQKLATLSSNRPLLKGKSLVKTWRAVCFELKKGNQQRVKVAKTAPDIMRSLFNFTE
jgi:ABC-type ATPase involved in cell division